MLADLTAAQLRAVLHYNPQTGQFRWRRGINHWRAGLPAGTEGNYGAKGHPYIVIGLGTTSKGVQNRYVLVGVKKRVYRAHRLAWLYVHGEWPKGEIDHVNGDGTDNRIANLRDATASQNGMNRGLRSNNTSGHRGVSWSKRSQKWVVHIGLGGKIMHLGLFDTIEEAIAVRAEASQRLHGAFARTD
jgi:hypothetical protein